MDKAELKQQIFNLVEQYSELHFAEKPFQAGTSVIPPSGKVLGAGELKKHGRGIPGWLAHCRAIQQCI